jgi:beta-lactam-binding protein with PASTA domain
VEDDLRTIAISRLFLDNIPHIKAYWVSYGKATTEMALAFGADDIDGTIGDTTKIYSMAGGTARPSMSVDELENMVRAAGMEPVERDSHYNVVVRREESVVEEPKRVESVAPKQKTETVKTEKESMTNNDTVSKRRGVAETQPKQSKGSKKQSASVKGGSIVTFFKRMPIIANIVAIGVVCLVLLCLLYFGLKSGTRHNQTIVVPDFVGMNIEDVRDVASQKDLKIVVRDSIFDVDLPGGTVVDQLPGTSDVRDVTVKPGRKIYVTINAYSRRQVTVPYVAKQTLRQALNQLERSGLTIDQLVYEPDMTSTDYVERQKIGNKEIGSSTKREVSVGTGVTLHVTYHRDEQYTIAPRIVGMSLAKAKSTLWDHGFNVGKVVYDESVGDIIDRRKARIYKQSVSIGSSQRRGSKVDLYLSADDALVDSLRMVADKDADRADAERRKQQAAKQRAADSLAALE